MTTYNTMNPVPSADARDRFDNSQVFDEYVTGTDLQTPDRMGVMRKTLTGLENDFNTFLVQSGFEPNHLTYVDGSPLQVDRPTQLIDRAGSVYRVKMPASFPVELTGTWATDQGELVDVGDLSLRLALAASSGAGLSGFTSATSYPANTVGSELKLLDAAISQAVIDLSQDITDSQNFTEGTRGGNLGTTIKLATKNLGAVGRSGIYSTPSGFNTRFGTIWFRKDSSGSAYLISNLDKYKPLGAFATPDNYAALGLTAYFVKPAARGGSDAAAGTSWATALATVAAASQKSNVDVIFVSYGNYFAGQHIGTYVGTRSISIQGVGGPVNFISGPVANTSPTWNATGTTGVYKQGNTDTFLTGVVALDYNDSAGNPLTLLPAADVAGVGTTPGSWFRSATELFISLPNFDVPTSNIYYYQSSPMRVTGGDKKFHHANINYIGGNAGAFSVRGGNGNTIVYGENIGCCGQLTGDGWQMKNMGLSIAYRVRCSRNGNDGFNYHGPDGVGTLDPHFIEIDCIGNESRAAGTGNGSTSHEFVRGIRLNSHYHGNAGPGIADVNDAQTYNVGVTSRENATYGAVASSDLTAAAGVQMWLDGCVFDGNGTEDVRAQNDATIVYRDLWSGRDRISVDGTSSAVPM